MTPSPQGEGKKALAFTRAKKINILQSVSLYISFAQQYQIQGDSLRGARGFKRGEAPLPMEGFREIEECKHSSGKVFDFSTLIKFEAAFPFLRSKKTVPWRYKRRISRGCITKLRTIKQRKKFQPITRSTHQRGITTSFVPCRGHLPLKGKAKRSLLRERSSIDQFCLSRAQKDNFFFVLQYAPFCVILYTRRAYARPLIRFLRRYTYVL